MSRLEILMIIQLSSLNCLKIKDSVTKHAAYTTISWQSRVHLVNEERFASVYTKQHRNFISKNQWWQIANGVKGRQVNKEFFWGSGREGMDTLNNNIQHSVSMATTEHSNCVLRLRAAHRPLIAAVNVASFGKVPRTNYFATKHDCFHAASESGACQHGRLQLSHTHTHTHTHTWSTGNTLAWQLTQIFHQFANSTLIIQLSPFNHYSLIFFSNSLKEFTLKPGSKHKTWIIILHINYSNTTIL